MSYRDWREEHDLRLSPTERVVLILMLLAVMTLIAFRIFDALPRADEGVTVELLSASAEAPPSDPPVELNTAGRAALMTLPGIGEAKADAILAYREEHGPFASVDELLNVKGIGPAVLEGLRERVYIDGSEEAGDFSDSRDSGE